MGASGRCALVTGGGKRVGAAIVRNLLDEGWAVALHHLDADVEAQSTAAEHPNILLVRADLERPDCADLIFDQIGRFGTPSLLVNNASCFAPDGLDDLTAGGWDRHLAVNARAPTLLIQRFAAERREKGGVVINILDAKLSNPNTDFFSYTISKMALAGVTEIAARKLARQGIRVCGIAPAMMLVSGEMDPAEFERLHRMTALGRGVTVDDLLRTLRYILETPTLTGSIVTLDAGQRFLGLQRDVQFL